MICTSIVNQPYESCRQLMAIAEMVELRIDRLDLSREQLHTLISEAKISVIATCREGKYEQKERLELLKLAIDSCVTYVDIELNAEKEYMIELIGYARSKSSRVIISHHDFVKTPTTKELHELVDACRACGADIVKLVTMAQSKEDTARVLSLYADFDSLAAFAMGEFGKISRLACVMLGSPFTYASAVAGKEAAEGQIAAADMKRCIDIFRS